MIVDQKAQCPPTIGLKKLTCTLKSSIPAAHQLWGQVLRVSPLESVAAAGNSQRRDERERERAVLPSEGCFALNPKP